MKKIILMAAAMFMMPEVGMAYHLEADGLYYRYSRGGLELIGSDYKNADESATQVDLVVPDSVYSPDFEHNLAVITLGEEAFAECASLRSVELPSTIDKIKPGVFYGSTSLVSVNMSACCQITEIPRGMFSHTSALETVVFPETLKKIGNMAFYGSGITDFTVPDGVDSIANSVFLNSSLRHFKMGKSLKVIGHYAINFDIETIEWNDSLTDIGIYAFHGMDTTEIVLPKSIRSIASGAFAEMSGLKRVVCKADNPSDIMVDTLAFAIADNKDVWYFMGEPMAPMVKIEYTPVPEGCVLYVPAQSVELYRQAEVWREFAEIRAIDDDETALEEVMAPAETDAAATYDLMGRRVTSPRPGQLVVSGGRLHRL